MTDKELFEKVEEKFNLKEKTNISKVFEKGNFNKAILEVRQSSAPTGLGSAIGSTLKYFTPTQFKTRAAQARKEKALAKQEELKAQKMEKELKGGSTGSNGEMDKYIKIVANRDKQFGQVYNKAARGEQLFANEQSIYDKGVKQADNLRKRDDVTKGKDAGLEAKRNEDINEIKNLLNAAAPGLSKHFIDKKKLDSYIKFSIGDEIKDVDLFTLAKVASDKLKNDQKELTSFRNIVGNNFKLTSERRGVFLKALPIKALPKEKPEPEPKKSPTAEEIIQKKLKERAKNNQRTKSEQIAFENELAAKFKEGDTVQSDDARGTLFTVEGYDKKTGTLKVRNNKTNRFSRRFARDVIPFMMIPDDKKKELKDKIKLQSQNEENFEQIIKRYR